jgi:hypothetical protein
VRIVLQVFTEIVGDIECIFFESCTFEVLARCGWYLYVGRLGSAGAQPFAIPEYL